MDNTKIYSMWSFAFGIFVSRLGDFLYQIALMSYIYKETGSAIREF